MARRQASSPGWIFSRCRLLISLAQREISDRPDQSRPLESSWPKSSHFNWSREAAIYLASSSNSRAAKADLQLTKCKIEEEDDGAAEEPLGHDWPAASRLLLIDSRGDAAAPAWQAAETASGSAMNRSRRFRRTRTGAESRESAKSIHEITPASRKAGRFRCCRCCCCCATAGCQDAAKQDELALDSFAARQARQLLPLGRAWPSRSARWLDNNNNINNSNHNVNIGSGRIKLQPFGLAKSSRHFAATLSRRCIWPAAMWPRRPRSGAC